MGKGQGEPEGSKAKRSEQNRGEEEEEEEEEEEGGSGSISRLCINTDLFHETDVLMFSCVRLRPIMMKLPQSAAGQ